MNIDAAALGVLALLAAAYWRLGGAVRRRVSICFAAGIGTLFFTRGAVRTYLQYHTWSAAPPGIFFLPPYQPFRYFIDYSLLHFFASFLLVFFSAGAVGLVLLLAARFRPGILEPGEIAAYLACAFLVRWPLVIPFTALVFGTLALRLMARKLILKDGAGMGIASSVFLSAVPFLAAGPWFTEALRLGQLVMPR
ncbi:MAG: hypothetical protein AAB692_03525 [Patescibacteria group bacterium]